MIASSTREELAAALLDARRDCQRLVAELRAKGYIIKAQEREIELMRVAIARLQREKEANV